MEFFVGGLVYSLGASELAASLRPLVELNAVMVQTDRVAGRSKGFGRIDVPEFALLDTPDDPAGLSQAAKQRARERLERLNRTELGGRRIVVTRRREPEPFLPALLDVLNQGGTQVSPNEEEFRDSLEVTQGGASIRDVLVPAALASVQAALGRVAVVDSRVLGYLANRRSHLHELLTPRQFEELVYELLRRTGFYDLQLTQPSRDGGADIFGRRVDHGRPNLYVVECKRWDPSNRVGSPTVQQTFGVMGLTQAEKAMVVTSSHFSGPARQWEAASDGRLILRNRDVVAGWIRALRPGAPDCMLWLPGDP